MAVNIVQSRLKLGWRKLCRDARFALLTKYYPGDEIKNKESARGMLPLREKTE
jgi:hypothetical protein